MVEISDLTNVFHPPSFWQACMYAHSCMSANTVCSMCVWQCFDVHVCVWIFSYIWIELRTYESCTRKFLHTCIYICMYMYMHTYVYIYIYIYVCIYIYSYIFMLICMLPPSPPYTYICIFVNIVILLWYVCSMFAACLQCVCSVFAVCCSVWLLKRALYFPTITHTLT